MWANGTAKVGWFGESLDRLILRQSKFPHAHKSRNPVKCHPVQTTRSDASPSVGMGSHHLRLPTPFDSPPPSTDTVGTSGDQVGSRTWIC